MTYQPDKFQTFATLVKQHALQEGPNVSTVENIGTFKSSTNQGKRPLIDPPAMWIVVQGRKVCYVGNQKFSFPTGNVALTFYPMSVEYEITDASPDMPYLLAGVILDLERLANVILRIERMEGSAPKPVSSNPSGIFSVPLSDNLLDPFIRLFTALSNPKEIAFLGASIIDEIYFRLLSNERGGELRYLLRQRGEIQRISRAVDFIHQNLDKSVSVEQLAEIVHMGQTSFYENFKKVMHLSPLQYAKSVKLDRAQMLLKEGKKANEAGYLVGYNNPAQFSREYKRHFGFPPSATQ
jgi:AraC-like DNA-binding protein